MQPGHTRPYQGYPYVNPMVIDAPSITPEHANRWSNLPRRAIAQGWKDPRFQNRAGSSSTQSTASPSVEALQPLPSKPDPDESPVVYIDLPESSGSDVVENREITEITDTDFVQDTIMFDPFENRRIDVAKRSEDSGSERSMSESSSTGYQASPGTSNAGPFTIYQYPEPQVHQGRLTRPSTLGLNRFPSQSNSMATNSVTYSSPRKIGLPSFLNDETCVYVGESSDGLPAASTNFPEPPPAYSENDSLGGSRSLNTEPRLPDAVVELPRTQVITTSEPTTPMGLPNYQRKFLTCHHCGQRVHTLVIKQNGYMTHIIACILFLIAIPMGFLVYCTDLFKHENHFCPNCNKLIGYFRPILGKKMYFVE